MFIQHNGNVLREIQFDESLCEVGRNPQVWQFKEFYDAATIGVELIWPYENYNRKRDTAPVYIEQLSSELFKVNFPSHLRGKENCSLLLFPHYSTYLPRHKNTPFPIAQCIEFDWWPGKLNVIFVERNCIFKKGKPFAQGIVIPRKEYAVKKNQLSEVEQASEFLDTHGNEYVTRRLQEDGFAEQNNLYERLSQLNKSGGLPNEIKKASDKDDIRIRWR